MGASAVGMGAAAGRRIEEGAQVRWRPRGRAQRRNTKLPAEDIWSAPVGGDLSNSETIRFLEICD
jgi:hypothetical protein